ncbi:MAG: FprA family A-type flavoprotein [Bacteroidales bacterium]|nr:FprA family A-type flavoprotein [Bacteroidales bacterium]
MIKDITPSVKFIGVDDLDLDLFESQYVVPEGMSYNSYLILDEKVAVLDTADARKGEAWKANLAEALGSRKPDYLVVHHMEPDHSALIAWMLEQYPSVTLVATAAALKMLPQFFEGIALEGRTLAVKEGDTLSLGAHTLRFTMAPMVHWPEVMVSYESSEKLLFSADAFGRFGAMEKTAFWGSDDDDWACEARRYYFNICGKYGVQVQNLLKKLAGADIAMICPLHGPVLNENLGYYLGLYQTWSSYGVETEGIFVAYASIHGGTAAAAECFAEILRRKGCPKVATADLTRGDLAEGVEDAFRYGKMVLAASSYDAGVFTPMHDFLYRLQAKGYQQRSVGLIENGSWAPSAGRVMKEMLGAMKDITLVEPLVTIRSRMHKEDLPKLEALADAMLLTER